MLPKFKKRWVSSSLTVFLPMSLSISLSLFHFAISSSLAFIYLLLATSILLVSISLSLSLIIFSCLSAILAPSHSLSLFSLFRCLCFYVLFPLPLCLYFCLCLSVSFFSPKRRETDRKLSIQVSVHHPHQLLPLLQNLTSAEHTKHHKLSHSLSFYSVLFLSYYFSRFLILSLISFSNFLFI